MFAGVWCTALLKIRTLIFGERRVSKNNSSGAKAKFCVKPKLSELKLRPPKNGTYHTNSLTEITVAPLCRYARITECCV